MKMKSIAIQFVILLICNFTNADQSLQCGDWDTYKDEKCFKVFDKALQSYSDAKNTCYQNEASSLLTIHSEEEQQILFDKLKNDHKIINDVWIDAQYKASVLKWTDTTTANYTNWANDNPTNISGYECVKIAMNEPHHGKWFNEPCEKSYTTVCEKQQNWLFSYLQKTVMEMRESLVNVTKQLEDKNKLLDNTIKELANTREEVTELRNEISKSVPCGTIAYFTKTTAPFGWLKANGDIVSRITYANLFATIGSTFGSGDGSTTFSLPDLRGEFIRGWSDGRNVDNSRGFGSFQWGSSVPTAGFINNTTNTVMSNAYQQDWGFAGVTYDDGFEIQIKPGETRNGITFINDTPYFVSGTAQGNITTWNALKGSRPRNIALLACIKY